LTMVLNLRRRPSESGGELCVMRIVTSSCVGSIQKIVPAVQSQPYWHATDTGVRPDRRRRSPSPGPTRFFRLGRGGSDRARRCAPCDRQCPRAGGRRRALPCSGASGRTAGKWAAVDTRLLGSWVCAAVTHRLHGLSAIAALDSGTKAQLHPPAMDDAAAPRRGPWLRLQLVAEIGACAPQDRRVRTPS
jgi:hypothetical protein